MKWPFLFLSIFMTLPVVGETLTMSTMDAMQLAGNLIERGDLSHAEPYFYWTAYDAARYVVYDGSFSKITEHDFTHRYSVRISNNKLDIWGFFVTTILHACRGRHTFCRLV